MGPACGFTIYVLQKPSKKAILKCFNRLNAMAHQWVPMGHMAFVLNTLANKNKCYKLGTELSIITTRTHFIDLVENCKLPFVFWFRCVLKVLNVSRDNFAIHNQKAFPIN